MLGLAGNIVIILAELGLQECILDFLELLGDVPEALREQITAEKEIDVLKHWHKLAVRAKDVKEFITMLS